MRHKLLKRSGWLLMVALIGATAVWAAVTDFSSDDNIIISDVTLGGGTANLILFNSSQAESWQYDNGSLTVTNPGTFKVGSADAAVVAIEAKQGSSLVECAYNSDPGTSYLTLPTSAGTYSIVLSNSSTACQTLCPALSNALTFNNYPTCGAATCEGGYQLSGRGSAAVCSVIINYSSGGGQVPTPTVPSTPPTPPPTPLPVLGCLSPLAENYNPAATVDNGSCLYPEANTEPPPTIPEPPTNVPVEPPSSANPPAVEPSVLANPNDETSSGAMTAAEPTANSTGSAPLSAVRQDVQAVVVAITQPLPTALKVIAPPVLITTGAISGIAGTVALTAEAASGYDLYLLLLRGIGAMLGFLGFRKKYPPWGTVYDAVTKRPIDPAYVRVIKARGQAEVTNAITDLDGRYGFLLPAGTYKLKAEKSHYQFPSKILAGKDQDALYGNLYFGEPLKAEAAEVTTKNIPLDPVGFDWNEFMKDKQRFFKIYSRREWWQARLFSILFALGLLSAMFVGLFKPNWFNGLVLLIYLIIYSFKWWWHRRHRPALVTKSFAGQSEPLSFAVIRAYLVGVDQEVKRVVADIFGRFYLLLQPGTYYFTVEEKLADQSYREVYRTAPLSLKTGLFNQNLSIQ